MQALSVRVQVGGRVTVAPAAPRERPSYAQTIALAPACVITKDGVVALARAIEACFDAPPKAEFNLTWPRETIRGYGIEDLSAALNDASKDPEALKVEFDQAASAIILDLAWRPHITIAGRNQKWVRESVAILVQDVAQHVDSRRARRIARYVLGGIASLVGVILGLAVVADSVRTFIGKPNTLPGSMFLILGIMAAALCIFGLSVLTPDPSARILLVRPLPWYEREVVKGAGMATGLLGFLFAAWQIVGPMLFPAP